MNPEIEEPPTASNETQDFNVISRGQKRKIFSFIQNADSKGFNLAGRPTTLKDLNQGIKRSEIKTIPPHNVTNLSLDPYWHFILRTNKHEWARLSHDSVSINLYADYLNPNVSSDTSATAEEKAARHACRAQSLKPDIFIDPTIQGTAFVQSVSVSVNNFPVTSNENLNNNLGHYVRAAHIFSKQRYGQYPHILTTKDLSSTNAGAALKAGRRPFDYKKYDATEGIRIPVFLDGIFPFDFRNKTTQTIHNLKDEPLYFPPDTTLDIKIYLHQSKLSAIFDKNILFNETSAGAYFKDGPAAANDEGIKLTVKDVTLSYESTEMTAPEYIKAMNEFTINKGFGVYNFDVPRFQNQSITPDQSYTDNTFQIPPEAIFICIMCLPDWAAIPLVSERKPLSGFTRFVPNATQIQIGFAGESSLITQSFNRFGIKGITNETSQLTYYKHLQKLKIFPYEYNALFPLDDTELSLVQCFLLDISRYASNKTELLTIKAQYNSSQSPKKYMYKVFSVHPTGRAEVRSPAGPFQWQWSIESS